MSDDDLLTTAGAARIAGVGASSLKRWADMNLIPCVRTAGGHRRFRRRDLQRFMREQNEANGYPVEPQGAVAGGDWATLFETASVHELHAELLHARARLGAWYAVAEELALGLSELGARWASGTLTVLGEHIATDNVTRAIQRVEESLPSISADPRAVLAAAEGDEHTLGLVLVELCLRECRWATVWAGRKTPMADLLALVDDGRVDMVAISASAKSANAQALARQAKRLGEVCRAAGCALVLGGRGAWPACPEYGTRLEDLRSLHMLATELRERFPAGAAKVGRTTMR